MPIILKLNEKKCVGLFEKKNVDAHLVLLIRRQMCHLLFSSPESLRRAI